MLLKTQHVWLVSAVSGAPYFLFGIAQTACDNRFWGPEFIRNNVEKQAGRRVEVLCPDPAAGSPAGGLTMHIKP